MKKILFSFLVIVLFSPALALADAMPDGSHPIAEYVSIENAAQYSAYNFYLEGYYHHGEGADQIMTTTTQPSDMFFEGNATLIAVKISDQNKIQSTFDPNDPETGDPWYDSATNTPYILSSNLTINFPPFLPNENVVYAQHFFIHIDRIVGQTIIAHVSGVETKDKNGTVLTPFLPTTDIVSTTSQPLTSIDKTSLSVSQKPQSVNPSSYSTGNAPFFAGILIVCSGIIGLLIGRFAWKK